MVQILTRPPARLFAIMDHDDDLDDPNYDADRYDDATGWQPNDPYRKLREKARKELKRTQIFGSMLQTLPANEWRMRREAKAGPPLFESIWKRGEMALLLGDKGACKSVLAVQIGANIARREKVLYIDCQRSGEQWEERYSSPCVPYGPRRRRHRFPRNFMRSALDWDGTVPEACKGGVSEFLRYSIMTEIDGSQAKVVILDDLTAIRGSSATGLASAVRMLKLWSVTENLSILALVPSKKTHKAAVLDDAIGGRQVCEAADTVFAIGSSTFAEDIRYVKHLASPHPITHGEANVLTYQLERTAGQHSSPPYEGGVADASSDGVVLSSAAPASSLITRHSSLSEGPFLGLTSLGPSEERDHLRDYAAEALAAELAHQTELKKLRRRSSKDILVDGVLNGSYGKYLKGE